MGKVLTCYINSNLSLPALSSYWLIQYLVVDQQLRGRTQALEQHHFVGLLGNGVRHWRPDASFRGTQPHANGKGVKLGDVMFDNCVHVICPCRKGQSVAFWERTARDTWEKQREWVCRISDRRSNRFVLSIFFLSMWSVSIRAGYRSVFLIFSF